MQNMKLNWEKTPVVRIACYIDKEEAIQINVIETGFDNTYIVVYDDAHQQFLGKGEVLSKEGIKNKFGIDISI